MTDLGFDSPARLCLERQLRATDRLVSRLRLERARLRKELQDLVRRCESEEVGQTWGELARAQEVVARMESSR